jgi:beta-lactamase regulating signal transducer with metallopeptidase domain
MNTLSSSWQLAGWTMILFLAAGTVLLIGAGAMRLLLRRANANVRYGASLMSFVLLAALPVMIAGTLVASRQRERPEELTTKDTKVTKEDFDANILLAKPELQRRDLTTTDLATEFTESTEEIGDNSIIIASVDPQIDFENLLNRSIDYLPWVWIVGTPLTFLLLASGLLGAERLRRSCRLLNDGPIHAACEELRIALKLSRQIGVAICDSISSPLVVGVVKPLILLPPVALTGWSPEHLEMVLVHELAHVRRWDNAVNLFQRVVESLLFFHPVVWIVSGWVRRDREDCCDAVVVRHTAKPQAYAELLLALAAHQPLVGLATSAAMARHPVASRIRRILKLQDEPMLVSRQAIGFLASAVLACVLAVGFLTTSEAEETVSREAERVADEREEETTNQTNRTNQDLATEGTEEELNARSAWEAEDASAADNSLTEYTIVYEVKGSGAKFAELIDHLRGLSEFKVTSSNEDQIVVMARRSVHKRVAEYLDFLRGIHEQPMKFANAANRPIIYAEQSEKLSEGLYKYSFLVPWVRAVDDPVRRATTEALIKSDLILSRAVNEMDLLEGTRPSVMEYLRKLSIHYSPDGHMFVALVGAKDGEAAVAAYAAPLINAYLQEHLIHQAKNQHDLATKDYRYVGEESVSRESERVADERSEASRKRERLESTADLTTKNTKDTKEDLATEDTESTEEEPGVRLEKLSDGRTKFSFIVSRVKIEEDAVRRATEEALIKSDLILNRAIDDLDISLPLVQNARPSLKDWLHREIGVEYNADGTVLITFVGRDEDKPQVEKIVKSVINAYLEEQRHQEDLATEDTESTEEGEQQVKISRVYELGEHEAEIKSWLKAIDELSDEINLFTKDDKEMAVITGTQQGHDILVERLERVRGNTKEGENKDDRTYRMVYPLGEFKGEVKEILEAVGGLRETQVITEDGKEMLVVGANKAGHEKLHNLVHNIRGEETNTLFPTLEEQRAADLAYKLLGVELEKLTPEELERVKAKGHQGGLRVTQTKAIAENQMARADSWHSGDILVGLHIWPTESFEDVTEVLNRDDLDQLSPMKFYILRRERTGGRGGGGFAGGPGTGEDHVVTGRIEVDLDAWRDMRARRKESLVNQAVRSTLPLRAATKKHQFAALKYAQALDANERVPGSVSEVDLKVLKSAVETAKSEVELLSSQIGRSETGERQQSDSESRPAAVESQDLYMPVDPTAKIDLSDSQLVTYDGKTFEEWRRMWRSELKTEKRTECIKALAAFARVGMGPDAAESVLEVAGEYNFGDSNSGPVLELKNAIKEVLVSGDGIPAEYWLPLLVERLKQDPEQWGSMASWVLRDVRSKNPEVLKLLISIVADQNIKSSLRRGALENIVNQLDTGNKEAEKVVRDALTSGDPMLALSALSQLNYTRLDQFPEQLDLLFSDDKNIRRQSHNWLDRVNNSPHTGLATERLLTISKDKERGEERGVALLALAEIAKMGEGRENNKLREKVWDQIIATLQNGDEELLPYALVAAANLQGSGFDYVVRQLGEKIDDGRRKQIEEYREKAEDLRSEYEK